MASLHVPWLEGWVQLGLWPGMPTHNLSSLYAQWGGRSPYMVLKAPTEYYKTQEVKAAILSRPGLRIWHNVISAMVYWSKQSQSPNKFRGGSHKQTGVMDV